jgi:lysophospholipase L1-like esterase
MSRATLLLLLATPALAQSPAQSPALMKYACGPANRMFATLSTTSLYSETRAGFDLNTLPEFTGKSCTSDKPFFFSAPVPEGSYRVTVVLGGDHDSNTTVWSEARRLSLEKITTKANASTTRTFNVNIRVPQIANQPVGDPSQVKLKPREIGNLDWDTKLTLEFNGDHPSLRSISIEPLAKDIPTIYLAGDSTVVDQDVEPWAAWGQMLPRFFTPGVIIANHAESGETIKSFVGEHRLAKVMSLIQPGDYLFIQFGHNDMKPNAVSLDEYKKLLIDYIAQARAKGATPVLVTSMNRRTFDAAGKITNSLAGYPDAVREIAAQQKTALIDLNAMSKTLFEAMGPDGSMKAFMHFPANAFPNQTEAISDDTHFNKYGAYELARCVVHGIREANLPIKKLLAKDIPDFNPARPDSQPDFNLPATPIPPKTTNVMKVPQT